MKKLLFTSVLLQLYAIHLSAGCEPRLSISKIYPSYESVSSASAFSQVTITLNPTDSIQLMSSSNQGTIGSCVKSIAQIYYNDALIFPQNNESSTKKFTLICKPGKYVVYTGAGGYTLTVVNRLEVGINEYEQEIQKLNLFPNPTHETVNISSEETLKSVLLYNSNAVLIKEFEPNNSVFSFPINEFPAGIYFVRITSVNDKKAVRKFIVR